MSDEIDYLLRTDSAGVRTYSERDGSALIHKVYEWLDTPLGSVWGRPEWGHRLEQFKHQPQSSDLEVAIELSIVSKMPRDIEITPSYIRTQFLGIDLVRINLGFQSVEIEAEVRL